MCFPVHIIIVSSAQGTEKPFGKYMATFSSKNHFGYGPALVQATIHSVVSIYLFIYFFFFCTLSLSNFWTSRGHRCRPFSPRFLPQIFIAHRVQQSHCSSTFHRVLLTHALALSASQFVHKKKSPRIYTSMHSAGLEFTKLTHTRLEDNLIRHRGDRLFMYPTE